MSYSGADKFSLWLGEYLTQNYDLPDHRGSDEYAQWAEDWEYYRQRVKAYEYERSSHLGNMSLSDPAMRQEDRSILIKTGQIMFGPYITLAAGNYALEIDADISEDVVLGITSNFGQVGVAEFQLRNGKHTYEFTLEEQTGEIEFVIVNRGEAPISILDVRLNRII